MGTAAVRTRVKICGITRPADARLAAESGADAIGLVFYPRSPRYLSVERAVEIRDALRSSGSYDDREALDELFDLLDLARAE